MKILISGETSTSVGLYNLGMWEGFEVQDDIPYGSLSDGILKLLPSVTGLCLAHEHMYLPDKEQIIVTRGDKTSRYNVSSYLMAFNLLILFCWISGITLSQSRAETDTFLTYN